MKHLSKTYSGKLESFGEALNGARQNLSAAGKLLVEMLNENEDTFELLISKFKVTLPFLESLERIGLGKLDPFLLTDPSPAAQRAVSAALPMRDQQRLINQYISVVKPDGDGGLKSVEKRMSELSSYESAQVIDVIGGCIRTPEEQTNYLRQRAIERASRSTRYIILGDRIHFNEGVTLTWLELSELADKIKPQAKDIEAKVKQNQIK